MDDYIQGSIRNAEENEARENELMEVIREQKEDMDDRIQPFPSSNKTAKSHGLSKHPLYKLWQSIKKRCYDKKNRFYKYYGKVGITMCDEWRYDFLSFYNWAMFHGWEEGLTVCRYSKYDNYFPAKCQIKEAPRDRV